MYAYIDQHADVQNKPFLTADCESFLDELETQADCVWVYVQRQID